MTGTEKIVVAGAGSIGCFVGGLLARAGRNVVLFGRQRIVEEIRSSGLHLTDLGELDAKLSPDAITVTADPLALNDAAIVLITVKSGGTAEMAQTIRDHTPSAAVIVSLQNGVSNAEVLRERLSNNRVLAGMVPFNVVHEGMGRFHRGTTGEIVIEAGAKGVVELLSVADLPIKEDNNMAGVLWGKLLLNLNNALNALSGLPLKEQLESAAWRRLLAQQQAEALAIMRAAKIVPHASPLPAALLPLVLRLPTALFRIIAGRSLAIDPVARSSMWEDLERGRTTEIAEFQGRIVALAHDFGQRAPLSERIIALVRAGETAQSGSPRLSPEQV